MKLHVTHTQINAKHSNLGEKIENVTMVIQQTDCKRKVHSVASNVIRARQSKVCFVNSAVVLERQLGCYARVWSKRMQCRKVAKSGWHEESFSLFTCCSNVYRLNPFSLVVCCWWFGKESCVG